MMPFADRRDAGQQLLELLDEYRQESDVVVLGLARGGMPVAAEVARALNAPLDVLIVRKLGVPGQPELAMGAVASGGVTVVNDEVARFFSDSKAFAATESRERVELRRRERLYRGARKALAVDGRTVVLVDDGAATGASMLAAVRAVRKLGAGKVIVALPTASVDAVRKLRKEADEVVCVGTPESFLGVGQWYLDFRQTTDEEVAALLEKQAEATSPEHGTGVGGTRKLKHSNN